MKRRTAFGLIVAIVVISVGTVLLRPGAGVADVPPPQSAELSLLTATPDDGFALAVRLSRMGVAQTQPNREVLQGLRPEYANDAESLIAASHVVAVHFQTIAAANDYWR